MEANPIRFTVELDAEAHPIEGLLRPEGADIPFVGWVGLAGAIERLIAARAATVGPEEPSETADERRGG